MPTASQLNKLASKIALFDDAFAYKELFRLYHSRLVQFASTISKSREAADEIVSDVFIKIWKNRHSLQRIENLHLYLYISTKNQAINLAGRSFLSTILLWE